MAEAGSALPARARIELARSVNNALHGTCPPQRAILPSHIEPTDTALTVRLGGARLDIVLSPTEVSLSETNRDAVALRILARAFGTPEDGPLEGRSRTPLTTLEQVRQLGSGTIPIRGRSSFIERVLAGQDISIIGPSSSGKSISAAQICTALSARGWTISWIDLSDPDRDERDLLLAACRTAVGPAKSHLVVVDDVQAGPSVMGRLRHLVPQLRAVAASRVQLLFVGWDSASSLIESEFPASVRVACKGDDVLQALAEHRGLSAIEVDQLRGLSKGDALIASLAIDLRAGLGRFPTIEEIAQRAVSRTIGGEQLSGDAVRLLYSICASNQFDIEVEADSAQALSSTGLAELLQRRIVRRAGNFLAVGHRSLAAMILHHLRRSPSQLPPGLDPPVRVAVQYLRSAGDRQILAVLERLDLASLAIRSEDHHGTAFLARAWESLRTLVRYVAKKAEADVTWGDNLASAVFAGEALAQVNHPGWHDVAAFVRDRWDIPEDGALPSPRARPSAERADFDEIQKRMVQEDREFTYRGIGDPADRIDFNRFHQTWTLGLLVGFEGTAREPSIERLRRLRRSAAHNQEPTGAFYPERVPWVTARVLLGLAAAGDTASNSDVCRRACDWLRTPSPAGPYRFGVWESGTGTWNTPAMTTALCILAMVRAGVSPSDRTIQAGSSYLLNARRQWSAPGGEIDAVAAVETLLAIGGRWREFATELATILTWSRDREPWTRTGRLASDSKEESSKVPFVARGLIEVVWETVKSELPALLEGIVITDEGTTMASASTVAPDLPLHTFADVATGCLQQLRRFIEGNVSERHLALAALPQTGRSRERAGAVEEALQRWMEREARLRKVENQLLEYRRTGNQDLRREVEEATDRLGAECLQQSWTPLAELAR